METITDRLNNYLREAQEKVERRNPRTKMFNHPTSYRYVNSYTTHLGIEVRCCYSCWKNVAGYYLSWVERRSADAGERSQWVAHKTKKAARACAERWAEDFRKNQSEGHMASREIN